MNLDIPWCLKSQNGRISLETLLKILRISKQALELTAALIGSHRANFQVLGEGWHIYMPGVAL